MPNNSSFDGHSQNDAGQGVSDSLAEHLKRTAARAAVSAGVFGAGEQAFAAGLLHDIGKYADQFQRRLKDPACVPGRDHWSAGARLCLMCYKHLGVAPALAIEGHHAGLASLEPWREAIERLRKAMRSHPDAFTDVDLSILKARFEHDGFGFPQIGDGATPSGTFSAADMLDVRMLFSTLVDADFVETEAHFAGDAREPRRYREDGPALKPAKALAAVEAAIEDLQPKSDTRSNIQRIRDQLLDHCTAAAERPTGLFTLSAPTGAGKTLAMLAFALRHAIKHELRRIVLVMPFLNIIDQTRKTYRKMFSPEAGFPEQFVIEHHSNVRTPRDEKSPEREDSVEEHVRIDRLLAENWDAPIILTTSVQCLESLMSDRPAACRKLHRLARSVILFDEVQTLPGPLTLPTLATLARLSDRFGTSVVFATATQPAFDHLHDSIITKQLVETGWRPTEIVTNAQEMYARASRRIRVRWRHREEMTWDEVAGELSAEAQVLCIVNLKRHARHLAELLRERDDDGLLHMSTSMCPAHREKVLEEVRVRLDNQRPIRLVSTQCVEAGVDLDFPVVYRAFGPLEAIAQAAGRCNRHGSQPETGVVHVFRPERDGRVMHPLGEYAQAAQVAEAYLNGIAAGGADLDEIEVLNDPTRLACYYRKLYALTGRVELTPEMALGLTACNFAEVAKKYRLIPGDTINIVVPYDLPKFEKLRAEQEAGFGSIKAVRDWIRRARPHAVGEYRPMPGSPRWNHLVPVQFSRRRYRDNDEATWFVADDSAEYDAELLGWLGGSGSLIV